MVIKSMDQEQMLLIVVLVGALLYMFLKDHKGGICSLFGGNKDTFIITAQRQGDGVNRPAIDGSGAPPPPPPPSPANDAAQFDAQMFKVSVDTTDFDLGPRME